jgi:long-chain fatty acid transport protein
LKFLLQPIDQSENLRRGRRNMKLKKIAALLAVAGPTAMIAPAFATNGMNMEGYGPVATAMGGASTAYENGTAGMINNAATLGLMKSGTSRLDIALGGLHPDVSARSAAAASATSGGNAYFMPAIGYVRKDGGLAWGVGMMSQGGMGTEYGSTSHMSFGTGREVRTELGVGRVMFPLAFDVSENVRIGGSLDYVWGGMDMSAVLDGGTFGAMFFNGMGGGAAKDNANKNLVGYATGASFANPAGPGFALLTSGAPAYHLNMNRGKDKFSQALTGSAFAANLGFVWTPTKAFSIGATYRPEVNFGDLEGSATMSAVGGTNVSFNGTMRIVDFKWPSTTAIGLSYQATDRLQLVADFKNVGWKNVMQQLHMKFSTSTGVIDMGLNQNWNDQNIVQFGLAYKFDDSITLRAGFSTSNQMVREQNMTPLFPATVKDHVMIGAGFAVSKTSSLDLSASMASKVSLTNTAGVFPAQQGFPAGASSSHSQGNWQLMYSQRF